MSLPPRTTHRMVVRHHPDFGHLFVPGIRARVIREHAGGLGGVGGASYVVTNAQGFRSDGPFVEPLGAAPRLLFFGDGLAAGEGCDNAERFPERIGRALGAEVYNYAVPGAGIDQQLLVYEKLARRVAADLVVLCVPVDGIARNRAAFWAATDRVSGGRLVVAKPYFTLEPGGLVLHHLPAPRSSFDAGASSVATVRAPAVDPLQLLAPQLRRLGNGARLRAARAAVEERLPWLMPTVRKHRSAQPYPDYATPDGVGSLLLRAILGRFIEAAVPTPVLIVPMPERAFYNDGLDPIYQPLFERFHAPGRGVHVMDLTRPLYELPWPDKKRLTFEGDRHFSPFGHEQIAAILADAIESRGLLRDALHDGLAPSVAAPMTLKSTGVAVPVAAFVAAFVTRERSPAVPAASVRRGTYVLGLSAFHPGAAAALIKDGEVVAAAREASFSRAAEESGFPIRAASYCLEEAGLDPKDLAAVVSYGNAPLAFEHLLRTLAAAGATGRSTWGRLVPGWVRDRLHVPQLVRRLLAYDGVVLHAPARRAHASSAFHPSPFERAAILTLYADDEGLSATIGIGTGRVVEILEEMVFPGSVDVEGALLRAARRAQARTGEKRVCFAGDLASSHVAGARLRSDGLFTEVWIQPAAGHADGALGAALDAYHTYFDKPRTLPADGRPRRSGSFLGPSYEDHEIRAFVETHGYPHRTLDPASRGDEIARLLAAGNVVGHVAGRLELGPYPLGARAVLGDVRNLEMRQRLTLGVAQRAPVMYSTLAERAGDPRPPHHDVIKAFDRLTGCAVVAGASFALPGEPPVCTPDDAYRAFMLADVDYLALGNLLLAKRDQPAWTEPPTRAPESAPDARERAYAAAIGGAFATHFLPAIGNLERGSTLPREPVASEPRGAPPGASLFAIPPALDADTPDPARLADAILACWEPGPFTNAMRRVLPELLAIRASFLDAPAGKPALHGAPAREDLTEQRSSVTYVIY